MRGFVIGVIATAITFAVVAWLLPSIKWGDDIVNLILVSVVAGVINGFIKPAVRLMSLPLTMATLGLFGLVINAALVLLLAWLADLIGLDFTVAGFAKEALSIDAIFAAFIAGIAISIVGSAVAIVIHD